MRMGADSQSFSTFHLRRPLQLSQLILCAITFSQQGNAWNMIISTVSCSLPTPSQDTQSILSLHLQHRSALCIHLRWLLLALFSIQQWWWGGGSLIHTMVMTISVITVMMIVTWITRMKIMLDLGLRETNKGNNDCRLQCIVDICKSDLHKTRWWVTQSAFLTRKMI